MTTAETGPQPIDEPLSDQEAQFLISVFEDNANLLRTMTQIDLQWVAAVMTFYAVGAGLLFTSPPSKVEIMNYVIVRIAYLMICLLSASFVSSKLMMWTPPPNGGAMVPIRLPNQREERAQ